MNPTAPMTMPEMTRVRQVFDAPVVEDIERELETRLRRLTLGERVRPGDRVAVTAGSRGIANIARILRGVAAHLKSLGAEPFLVPAMGSHGGGSAEGQTSVLKSLGITEEAVGAPVRSSMEVVEIDRTRHGYPVLVDRHAADADGVVVVNRVKPHTEFEGPIESGLLKMLAIGLGKHRGCLAVHRQTVQYGYRNVIPEIGGRILEKLPVLAGVGVVENHNDQTALLEVMAPGAIFEQEAALLAKAKRLMARLPFEALDVLVVDQMGKDISGTGMDTNVIGRIMFVGEPEPQRPAITRIVVLGLTPATHGNAVGIGLADYTTRRVISEIDLEAMATNAIAAMTPEKGRLPIALATEREAVEAALLTIGAIEAPDARVVHVKNTLELREMDVSASLMAEVGAREDLAVVRPLGPMAFGPDGALRGKLGGTS